MIRRPLEQQRLQSLCFEPFEHRTQRTIGAGLWAARRLVAQLPGVGLQVCQDGEDVKAVLRLPIESNPDIRP